MSIKAARQQFEPYSLAGDVSIVYLPQPSINSCFKSISKDECDFSVIPFENSSNGQVVLTYDLFRDWFIQEDRLKIKLREMEQSTSSEASSTKTRDFQVIAEQFVTIHHNFITYSNDISKITTIYSHPQVWSQCNKFLHKHELDNNIKIQKIDTSSTSKAVEIVASLKTEEQRQTTAAMASLTASEIHGVPVKVSQIEDFKGNTTRFLVLSKKQLPVLDSSIALNKVSDKRLTLLTFIIKNNDNFGSLCDILQVFKQYNLNLQSITTRPSVVSPWRYVFFVEVWEGSGMASALNEIEDLVLDLTVLGSFPRSDKFFQMIEQSI
ncbi:hypothetical protein OGAPHI_004194 [Ogataea philodendri]|uniref:prephenate dehydratase n=1 Tax=Ogataea philodendri TaxID=1378263 RepID=A0A9P8T5D9_9ASCO|nr:uncharacterized protein OGAPHI_004194 [Ogataea philodendri]KAH3666005.1 hypothetical protein OGAPHI_004194 [Ogataea philodendri]